MAEYEGRVIFSDKTPFGREIQARVRQYLAQLGIKDAGYRRLHRKAMIIIAWAVAAYLALLLLTHGWWQIATCGICFTLALNAAAFCIMHDGNHRAFSRRKWSNRLAGFVLELIGGTSITWVKSHNDAHHNQPNMVKRDGDIDLLPWGRVASTQPWHRWHRFQHLYMCALYGVVLLRMQVGTEDVPNLIRRRVGYLELKGSRVPNLTQLVGAKLLFISWALALPMLLNWSAHGVAMIAVAFLCLNFVFSFVMVWVFQLAHCVDETVFTSLADVDENGNVDVPWAEYQMMTTTDFCTGDRLIDRIITWFVGGLNYQAIHHLFPTVAHTHYPAIAKIVAEVCQEHGVTYLRQPTLWSAIKSHFRHLYNMGRPPKVGVA